MTPQEVRRNLNRWVYWRGKSYLFTGCIIRLVKGGFVYQAELTEKRESMTTLYIAALEEVESEGYPTVRRMRTDDGRNSWKTPPPGFTSPAWRRCGRCSERKRKHFPARN